LVRDLVRRREDHRMTVRYRTIVADPPWPITWTMGTTRINGRGERHPILKRELGYPTMPLDTIAALDIEALAAPDAHLYLWTVDRFLIAGDAARIARAWGFEPKRLLVWRKSGFGLGTFPRPQHEVCVIATRGHLPFAVRNTGSVQSWPVVYERRGNSAGRCHSAKPEAFLDLVEQASPGPYLELFARRQRLGWDTWGDEALCHVELA
jgi:N6-adenosine-specific RNA methylase IME4